MDDFGGDGCGLRLRAPLQEIVDLNFHSGPHATVPARLHLYNAAFHLRYQEPVRSVAILLRLKADGADLTGKLAYVCGGKRVESNYDLVRMWKEPVETFLRGGLGLLPLATLCRMPEDKPLREALREVVREIDRRLVGETDCCMRKKDPYEVLGIERDATHEQAKKNFRILARQFHPDRNPGDEAAEARFKEVEAAWSALEHVLPKSALPLVIPEGASEQEIEDAYVKWLLDPKNAPPDGPPKYAAPAPAPAEETHIWSTVAGDKAGGMVVRGPSGDWRKLKIRRFQRYGLEAISAEQAARLLDSHPNAFAVLKMVQQHSPQLCLYDAILWRAQYARRSKSVSSGTALVIVGAAAVDEKACEKALRDPLASVELAQENLHVIAPHVKFAGAVIPPQKLAVDVYFLEENIRELSATLPSQSSQPPATGTDIVPQ